MPEQGAAPPRWLGRLLSLSLALLLLVGLEGGARLFDDPGRLDEILAILEQHPRLLWRNRPLLETTFQGEPVHTDALGLRTAPEGAPADWAQASPRVVCLGGSPSFGWGVRHEQTYAAQLEERLRAGPLPQARVRNAGMVGWSSHQGRQLLEGPIRALQPDIVTIAYVINDVDSYRFFRSDGRPDRDLEPASPTLVSLRNLLDHLAFFRLWERGLLRLTSGGGGDGTVGVELFRPGSVRVPPEHYRDNLEAMVETARAMGAQPILLVMPVNLPLGPAVAPEDRDRAGELLDRATALFDQGDCAGAEPLAREATALDPTASAAWFVQGACARRDGNSDAARERFEATMEAEGHRCARAGLAYNARMRSLAGELGAELVDAAAVLLPLGDPMFEDPVTDPIHPSPGGHAVIAELLAERIATTPGTDLDVVPPTGEREPGDTLGPGAL